MDSEITATLGTAIIFGIVQGVKTLNLYETKWNFVLSMFLGVVGGIVFLSEGDVKRGIIVGLMMGLSASGFFSGTKNFIEKKEEE